MNWEDEIQDIQLGFADWARELVGDFRDDGELDKRFNCHDAGLDHLRTYKDKVAIAHPYRATEELGEWLTILKTHGVEVAIEGSPYYSGLSFQIVIWRMEDDNVAEEYLRLMDKLAAEWTKKTNSSGKT